MEEEIEGLPTVSGPYEILELADGQTLELEVEEWKVGKMLLTPKSTGVEKVIKVLRVWVPKEKKDFFPYYWDITSQTLIAQLEPHLSRSDLRKYKYAITKHGVAPRARFTLEVKPK